MSKEIQIFNKTKWHFRRNKKRKLGNANKGAHPSLVVGQSKDGKSYINLGLTKNSKRGHHKNVQIHNPQNWNKKAYVRDDIRADSKEYLSIVLNDYKFCPEDIDKIWEIIKKRTPSGR